MSNLNIRSVENISYEFLPLNSIGIVYKDLDGYSLINTEDGIIIHRITIWPIEMVLLYRIIENKILLYEVIQRDLVTGCVYPFKWKQDKSFYYDSVEGFDSKCMIIKSWDEYFNIKEVRDYVISKGGSFSDDNQ